MGAEQCAVEMAAPPQHNSASHKTQNEVGKHGTQVQVRKKAQSQERRRAVFHGAWH